MTFVPDNYIFVPFKHVSLHGLNGSVYKTHRSTVHKAVTKSLNNLVEYLSLKILPVEDRTYARHLDRTIDSRKSLTFVSYGTKSIPNIFESFNKLYICLDILRDFIKKNPIPCHLRMSVVEARDLRKDTIDVL